MLGPAFQDSANGKDVCAAFAVRMGLFVAVTVYAWATLFRLLGEFEDIREAVYHSAVNFATLGYGDTVMSEKHRFLGPLEAINGVLMIGASTAALTAAFQDAIRKGLSARQGG